MFGARSWIRRAGFSVAVLVALAAGLPIVPHADGSEDASCRPLLVSHDESAHYIGAGPSQRSDGQHCYLCHAARSFFPAFDQYEQREGARRAERLHAAPLVVADRFEWSLVLGRAPPA